eukprot:366450-Chlamydomonas_euryale.AAC.35
MSSIAETRMEGIERRSVSAGTLNRCIENSWEGQGRAERRRPSFQSIAEYARRRGGALWRGADGARAADGAVPTCAHARGAGPGDAGAVADYVPGQPGAVACQGRRAGRPGLRPRRHRDRQGDAGVREPGGRLHRQAAGAGGHQQHPCGPARCSHGGGRGRRAQVRRILTQRTRSRDGTAEGGNPCCSPRHACCRALEKPFQLPGVHGAPLACARPC